MSTTLVLGGVRSGKSRHAESLLRDRERVTYVATAAAHDASDPRWAERVARHRARRPPGWRTVETTDLAGVIGAATTPLLIDCLGVWLARTADLIGWDRDDLSMRLAEETEVLLGAWGSVSVEVVAVSNEVGLGVVPPMPSGQVFRDELGSLNARLAAVSDRVHLVVAGRVIDLGDAPVVGE